MNLKLNESQQGFTIIEVVIALVLLSLLMLAMITAMRTLGDTQTRIQEVISRTDEMRMVSRFLRQSIRQARATLRVEKDEEKGSYFEGTKSELVWVAPLSVGATVGGLNVIRLSTKNAQLIIQFQMFKSSKDEPDWGEVKAYVLIDNLESFALGYRSEKGEPWQDAWERTEKNPRSVRLEIQKQSKFWPEMIVSLDDGLVYEEISWDR